MAKFSFPSALREQSIVVVYHVPMQIHIIIYGTRYFFMSARCGAYTQEKLIEPQGFKGFCARIPLKCAQHCRRPMQYQCIAVNQIIRVSRVMPSPRIFRLRETSEHCWYYIRILWYIQIYVATSCTYEIKFKTKEFCVYCLRYLER